MKKQEKWVVIAKSADFNAIGKKYGVDPVIARIARNREVISPDQLDAYFNPSERDLNEPKLLKGAQAAAELLEKKIKEQRPIRIIGDYDIDGICATYILLHGLRACGAVVDDVLPHRINDGYGLNKKLIQEAYEDGCDTILTCDNGIAAADEIAYARELGLTVIVTDHHEVPLHWENEQSTPILPDANVVVDPKQHGETYPYKNICGAVVAWKVLQLVQEKFGKTEQWRKYLTAAAVATVGDVMELQGENRSIVALGLQQMRTEPDVGWQALIQQNQLKPEQLRAYHIGYVIGPCMNATGRLDTAKRALKLLLAEDQIEATELAQELVALNESRKSLTTKNLDDAVKQVEAEELWKNPVLVVYLPECHESLAGIIAGRLRERYYRPCLVLTKGETCLKGSGRSIPSYHMYQRLSRVGHLFLKFGGHAMAAGVSLTEEQLPQLKRELMEDADLTPEDLIEKISIDVPMPLTYITETLVSQLSILEPCGNGNEKPIFADRNLCARSARYIGKNQNMLKLQLICGNGTMDALYFGAADEFCTYYANKYGEDQVQALFAGRPQQIRFAFTYYPQVNEYQGTSRLQIVITNYL